MKKLLSIVLSAALILSSSAAAFATDVKINDSKVKFTEESGQPFVDASNRTQVPFRQTLETFGASVSWNQQTQTAIAEMDGIKVEVPIGKNYIIKDGKQITNDTAALVKDGRTYLPIRAVLEAFGANVKWDNATQTVVVVMAGVANVEGTAKEDLTVHFINVGQGDSILIDKGDFEILVDAGPRASANTVTNYIKPFVQGDLDVVVATHEHEDHIGGLPAVLAAYKVDKVIDNGRSATSKIYEEYATAVAGEGCEHLTSSSNQNITVALGGDANFRVLAMTGTYSDPNNNSVVSLLEYGTIKVLLTGDAEKAVEQQNLSSFPDVNILKAGHHGSSTASSSEFLAKTKPETVIISAATGNTYKHPHLAGLQRFANVNAKAYGTFKSGNIIATIDGNNYTLNTTSVVTTADAGDETTNQTSLSYIGNANSKIFHELTCGSVKQMSDRNKVSLQNRAEAISKGYAPCKTCKP